MHPRTILGAVLVAALASGSARAGTVYHFQQGKRSGTVSVAGDDARREFDPSEEAAGAADVEIWKNGGKQRLLLYSASRTYYDAVASGEEESRSEATLDTLSARDPFVVKGARKIQVAVQSPPAAPAGTAGCRPASLTFSYELELRLASAGLALPARVEGSASFCLVDSLPVSTLPFGQGREIVTGIAEVDAALAQRLATLAGVPLERTITARRRIEGGEEVSASERLVLSDFRTVDIPAERFEVPKDYRYQKPQISAPVREVP